MNFGDHWNQLQIPETWKWFDPLGLAIYFTVNSNSLQIAITNFYYSLLVNIHLIILQIFTRRFNIELQWGWWMGEGGLGLYWENFELWEGNTEDYSISLQKGKE